MGVDAACAVKVVATADGGRAYALLRIYIFPRRIPATFHKIQCLYEGRDARRIVLTLYTLEFSRRRPAAPRRRSGFHSAGNRHAFISPSIRHGEDRFRRMKFPCDRGGSTTRRPPFRSMRSTSDASAVCDCETLWETIPQVPSQQRFPNIELSSELICIRSIPCMQYVASCVLFLELHSLWISLKIQFRFNIDVS